MATSRFDADADAPYGSCTDCSITLATEADADAHMDETLAASSAGSHRIRVANPPRASRIEDAVSDLVRDATNDFVERLQELTDRGDLSEDEATSATRPWAHFAEAWSDREE